MSNKKFFTLVFCMAVLFAGLFSSGCGGGGHSELFYNDADEPNTSGTYTVIFDSMGGSEVKSQEVEADGLAVEPDVPENGTLYFFGWYLSQGYSRRFKFSTPISRDLTLYAKWFDPDDTQDTDNDGLSDSLEITFGTDPENIDTDDDGLTDYDELNWLDYNPLESDTDGNGINDGDEDPDEDGLTNIEEGNNNTSMIVSDTDYDGLSDYEEIRIYNTDPLNPDTDGDGVNDGLEVILGSDPVTPETSFTTTAASHLTDSHDWAIDIRVVMNSPAEGAGTLQVRHANYGDSPFITRSIPGNLDSVYKITSSGDINSASITFTLGRDAGDFSENFQPRIYYLNEETGLLEELENQNISEQDRTITAEVSHFSIYLLLNKIEFDAVWDYEIKPPAVKSGDKSGNDQGALDVVLVIDGSGSMKTNDPGRLAVELAKKFIDKLRNGIDKGAVIKIGDYSHILQSLTTDKTLLKNAIENIRYDEWTAIRRSLTDAVNILEQSDTLHKYIILLTDGEDTEGATTINHYKDLLAKAVSNDIIIYTIGLGNYAAEQLLQEIASHTNGKYYHATATDDAGDSLKLEDVFSDIEDDTLADTKTDSNNDGISDYYIALINDGTIKLSNGTMPFAGVLDRHDPEDKDWDNDGLLNGEEISVITHRGKTYIYMKSNPELADTDFDGYSDYKEVKKLKTSPLKKTMRINLAAVADDNYFSEVEVRKYQEFSHSPLLIPFDINKVNTAEKVLIDYFTTYTTKKAVSKDAEAEMQVQYLQNWIDGLDIAANLIGCAGQIVNIAGGIGSGQYTNEIFNKKDEEHIKESLELGQKIAPVLNKAIKNDRARINTANFIMDMKYYEVFDKTMSINDAVREVDSFINGIIDNVDKLTSSSKLSNIAGVTEILNNLAAVVNQADTLRQKFWKIEIPFKFEWAENMSKSLFKNSKITKLDGVGIAFNLVTDLTTMVSDVLKVHQTYGKIAANYAEFLKYMSLLYYIENDKDAPDYLKKAAWNIAVRMQKDTPDWDSFDRRANLLAVKEGALGTAKAFINAAVSVLSIAHPAVGAGIAVAKLVYALSGIDEKQEAIIKAQVNYGILRSSRLFLGRAAYGTYVDADDEGKFLYSNKYAVQLVQARIVGLNSMMDYLLDANWSSLWDRGWFQADAVRKEYTAKIKEVYEAAKNALLELSHGLPMYNEFGW